MLEPHDALQAIAAAAIAAATAAAISAATSAAAGVLALLGTEEEQPSPAHLDPARAYAPPRQLPQPPLLYAQRALAQEVIAFPGGGDGGGDGGGGGGDARTTTTTRQ